MKETEEKPKKRKYRKKESGITETDRRLEPLRLAAVRIADILCAVSADKDIFVSDSDSQPSRRIDTKTLKEFTSVIKEISGVICELNGIETEQKSESGGIKIEFDYDADKYSV